MSSSLAIFLDRDGVINRNVVDSVTGEYGAPRVPEEFELAPGAIEALLLLQQAGFALFLISNQPNFAKGKSSLEDLAGIQDRLQSELDRAGVEFTEFYYCYHHPRGVVAGYCGPCECRKPSPYFLLLARERYGLRLEESWIVGDRISDIECGRAAGVRTIRVDEDHPALRRMDEVEADFEAVDLAGATQIILNSLNQATSDERTQPI